jgi:hypothetical protein
VAQLPPDDQLLQKRLGALAAFSLHLQRHVKRRDLAEVQIGTQVRLAVQIWIIPSRRIGVEPIGQEIIESALGFLGPAVKTVYPADCAVHSEIRDDTINVAQIQATQSQAQGIVTDLSRLQVDQIGVQFPADSGSECPGGEVLLIRRLLHRNDQIRLNLDQSAFESLPHLGPPLPLDSEVPCVHNHRACVAGQFGNARRRGLGENYRLDTSLAEIPPDASQPFEHEMIVAGVGLGEVRRQSEGNDDRLAQFVALVDRVFQGVVALSTLGRLHPVQHVPALSRRPAIQPPDSFAMNHRPVRLPRTHDRPGSEPCRAPKLYICDRTEFIAAAWIPALVGPLACLRSCFYRTSHAASRFDPQRRSGVSRAGIRRRHTES